MRNRVDGRTRRLVTHFRQFFRCFNAKGEPTEAEDEIARIELTQRCVEYWKQQGGPLRRRIPEPA